MYRRFTAPCRQVVIVFASSVSTFNTTIIVSILGLEDFTILITPSHLLQFAETTKITGKLVQIFSLSLISNLSPPYFLTVRHQLLKYTIILVNTASCISEWLSIAVPSFQ
jgi:hypothetical protein